MKRAKTRGLINQLPDEILSIIISSLSIDEAVRSSIFSQRWKSIWKHATELNFDMLQMRKPLSTIKKSKSGDMSFELMENAADIYGEIVDTILYNHIGDLTSCSFKHYSENLEFGHLKAWLDFLVEKHQKLSSLILQCLSSNIDFDHYSSAHVPNENVLAYFEPSIFSNLCSLELTNYVLDSSVSYAFEFCEKLINLKMSKMKMEDDTVNDILENCESLEKFSLIESTGFKTLKVLNSSLKSLELMWLIIDEIDVSVEDLQDVVLDSIICPPKGLRIFAPNLRTFHSTCDPIAQNIQTYHNSQSVLKSQEILENCSNLFESRSTTIFRNLLTLSIDLDLNNIREAMALAYILRSCIYLETLQISIPVKEASDSTDTSDDEGALPFPKSMFWARRDMYNCINNQLKFLTVRGFMGKEQEMQFLEHVIKRATMIKEICVIHGSSLAMKEAKKLLLLKKASVYLSIILKPAGNKNFTDVGKVRKKISILKRGYPFI